MSLWTYQFSGLEIWLYSISIKATVLLMAAVLVGLMLRRSDARTRRAIWCTTVFGVVAIPILSFLPSVHRLSVLPALPSTDIDEATFESTGFSPEVIPFQTADNISASQTRPQSSTLLSDTPSETAQPHALEQPSPDFASSQIVFLVWIAGVAILLIRIQIGVAWLWRLTRLGTVATENEWSRIGKWANCSSKDWRVPKLVWSNAITTPMTWGVWRPVILVPAHSQSWSDDHLRSIILHERSHIKRHDWVFQILAELACAFHWFNPLVWRVKRNLSLDREFVCDADVVDDGISASTYAGHLLETTRLVAKQKSVSSMGIAMAQESQLKERIMFILRKDSPRRHGIVNVVILLACSALSVTFLGVTKLEFAQPKADGEVASSESTPAEADGELSEVQLEEADQNQTEFAVLNLTDFTGLIFTTSQWKSSDSNLLRISDATFGGDVELIGYEGESDFILRKCFLDGALQVFFYETGVIELPSNDLEDAEEPQSTIVMASYFNNTECRLTIARNLDGTQTRDWRIDGQACEFDEESRNWAKQLSVIKDEFKQITDLRGAKHAMYLEMGYLKNQATRLEIRRQALIDQRNEAAFKQRRAEDKDSTIVDGLNESIANIDDQLEKLDVDGQIQKIKNQIADFDSTTDLIQQDELLEEKLKLFTNLCDSLNRD